MFGNPRKADASASDALGVGTAPVPAAATVVVRIISETSKKNSCANCFGEMIKFY